MTQTFSFELPVSIFKIRDSAIDADFWMNQIWAELWCSLPIDLDCLRFSSALQTAIDKIGEQQGFTV